MTHASVPKEQRKVLGISDTLVSCTFVTLWTERNLTSVNFRKDFWDVSGTKEKLANS